MATRKCSIPNCQEGADKASYCSKHQKEYVVNPDAVVAVTTAVTVSVNAAKSLRRPGDHPDDTCWAQEITEFLFLGCVKAAHDRYGLLSKGIRHVINVSINLAHPFSSDILYHRVAVQDTDSVDIKSHFAECNAIIEQAIKEKTGVFVHCHQGMSRSASIVIAFCMKALNMNLREAYFHCKQKRWSVSPNPGFIKQLAEYERELGRVPPGAPSSLDFTLYETRRYEGEFWPDEYVDATGRYLMWCCHPLNHQGIIDKEKLEEKDPRQEKRRASLNLLKGVLPGMGPGGSPREQPIPFDDLEIASEIGEGFFGTVYKCVHKETGAVFALKKVKPQKGAQGRLAFVKESNRLQSLSHPNLLPHLGSYLRDDGCYLLTPLLTKGSLLNILQARHRRLPWAVRLKILLEVASGAQYLHSKQIIHRDLKADNILIGEDNVAIVADLGLSRRMPESPRRMTVCGSVYWMAPEVLNGQEYDARCDIFSFGVLCLEVSCRVLAEELPREADFGVCVEDVLKDCPPDDPQGMPPALVELISKCVQLDMKKRPSFEEVVASLEVICKATPVNPRERVAFDGTVTHVQRLASIVQTHIANNQDQRNQLTQQLKSSVKIRDEPKPKPTANTGSTSSTSSTGGSTKGSSVSSVGGSSVSSTAKVDKAAPSGSKPASGSVSVSVRSSVSGSAESAEEISAALNDSVEEILDLILNDETDGEIGPNGLRRSSTGDAPSAIVNALKIATRPISTSITGTSTTSTTHDSNLEATNRRRAEEISYTLSQFMNPTRMNILKGVSPATAKARAQQPAQPAKPTGGTPPNRSPVITGGPGPMASPQQAHRMMRLNAELRRSMDVIVLEGDEEEGEEGSMSESKSGSRSKESEQQRKENQERFLLEIKSKMRAKAGDNPVGSPRSPQARNIYSKLVVKRIPISPVRTPTQQQRGSRIGQAKFLVPKRKPTVDQHPQQ